MKQRLGVWVEDIGLALLRLSDRLRGTDHGPLPAMAYEVPPLTFEEQMANVNQIAWVPSDELIAQSARHIGRKLTIGKHVISEDDLRRWMPSARPLHDDGYPVEEMGS